MKIELFEQVFIFIGINQVDTGEKIDAFDSKKN
jgi:hypothetical protein